VHGTRVARLVPISTDRVITTKTPRHQADGRQNASKEFQLGALVSWW